MTLEARPRREVQWVPNPPCVSLRPRNDTEEHGKNWWCWPEQGGEIRWNDCSDWIRFFENLTMTDNWQLVIVGAIVAGAAAWLLREVWRIVRPGKQSGCGSCGSCATPGNAAEHPSFVSLEKLERDARKS